jgi:hypothetical protein
VVLLGLKLRGRIRLGMRLLWLRSKCSWVDAHGATHAHDITHTIHDLLLLLQQLSRVHGGMDALHAAHHAHTIHELSRVDSAHRGRVL